jgi:serine/threonine protein kinase
MSSVHRPKSGGLPPVPPGGRPPTDRRIVELEGLDGAISLARLLDTLHRSSHRLPVHVAVYITHEVARALRHLHDKVDPMGHPTGLVHGAVNGENVLLLRSGRVKLIARGPLSTSGDRNADLFRLGLVAWEMLVGWPPPEAGDAAGERAAPVPPSSLRPGLPSAVDLLVLRALERSPRRRHASAAALAADTARFLATRPDPRRGLRLLLHQRLDAGQADESGVTQRTHVPWRDGSGALPALPPPPPPSRTQTLPPSAGVPLPPIERPVHAPVTTLSVRTRDLLQRRPWLSRVGVFVFQTAVAAILAWAALLALDVGRREHDVAAPSSTSPSGAVIVPMTERAPPSGTTEPGARHNHQR